MTNRETLLGLLVALVAGALIGLERQSQKASSEPGFGGVRTFPLIALFGALLGLLGSDGRPWPVVAGFMVLGALLAVAYWHSDEHGLTSEVAALVAYVLGAIAVEPLEGLALRERFLLVIGAAAVVTGALSLKQPLHRVATRVTADEIFATVKLLLLLAVVLPLVPSEPIGPFGAINPFDIALMIGLIATVGFVGYMAVRIFGARRGTIFTGLLGGLVSSTAVTVGMAEHARAEPQTTDSAVIAVIASASMMFARMLVLVGIVERGLLPALTWSLGSMCVMGGAVAYVLYRKRSVTPASEKVTVRNPFALGPALKFGLLFAVILVAVKAAQHYAGNRGLYISSVIAGTTDVDAITLSMVKLFGQGLSAKVAAVAITLAAATNTLVKVGIGWAVGGAHFGRRLAWPIALMLAVGAGTTLIVS